MPNCCLDLQRAGGEQILLGSEERGVLGQSKIYCLLHRQSPWRDDAGKAAQAFGRGWNIQAGTICAARLG
ncbi:MAG: hypothetical protein NVSMB62_01000 [Acidobacteriaceae bacterium]